MVVVSLSAPAAATAEDAQAAELFARGRAEYRRGEYQRAYDDFKQAYLLSARPPLIYNMARALEGLRRYGEAADALRSYLRVSPSDPDHAQIEEHIRALDEARRMQPAVAGAAAPPTETKNRKRTLAIVIAVTSVVVTGLAVGLGVGLGRRGTDYSSADVGPLKSTP
jgi:tetratricopeptide (TPR) repeat protein